MFVLEGDAFNGAGGCIQACLLATEYTCLSFDFKPENSVCNLDRVKPGDVGVEVSDIARHSLFVRQCA